MPPSLRWCRCWNSVDVSGTAVHDCNPASIWVKRLLWWSEGAVILRLLLLCLRCGTPEQANTDGMAVLLTSVMHCCSITSSTAPTPSPPCPASATAAQGYGQMQDKMGSYISTCC